MPSENPVCYRVNVGLIGEGIPHATILLNGVKYFDGFLNDGLTDVEFEVNNHKRRQLLKVIFDNKQPGDTVLDEHGNIIRDKLLGIKYIKFDGVIIRNYIYKSKFKDWKSKKCYYSDLFGFNGEWRLYYNNPPLLHMAKFNKSDLFENQEKMKIHQKYFDELLNIYTESESYKSQN